MRKKLLVILVAYLCLIQNAELNIGQECVFVYECPAIVARLIQPISPETRDILRSDHCGYIGFVPMVWCASPVRNQNAKLSYNGKECVFIHDCPSILATIVQPLSEDTRITLQTEHCGYVGFQPMIWCEFPRKKVYSILPNPENHGCGRVPRDNQGRRKRSSAELGEFAWLAVLEYKISDNEIIPACGGTLINREYVLTAAQCVQLNDHNRKLVAVLLGEYDINKEKDCERSDPTQCYQSSKKYEVYSTVTHPLYEVGFNDHDVGLVRLKQLVQYTEFIKPICLPTEDFLKRRDTVAIAGWNINKYGYGKVYPQKYQLRYMDKSECSLQLGEKLEETQFCTKGDSSQDSCAEDLGGPVMLGSKKTGTVYQIGIATIVDETCENGRPVTKYTHIKHYLSWIYKTISSK